MDVDYQTFCEGTQMEVKYSISEKAQRDYQLVQQALQHGDQRAYAELLNNYRESLYFLLLKMTNDPDDAEDLTIEAFGKAFRNLHQYTPNYAFSTWLFRIAANNCIDFMRKKKKNMLGSSELTEDTDPFADLTGFIPSQGLDPEEAYIKKQKATVLREIVDRLKPKYRKLIHMRYFREMSYEEIAQELDMPMGTVKAQLFRAREFLTQILQDRKGVI